MRILFIAPYVPSLIRVRPYYLVRGLALRGHQVTVATLIESREDSDAAARLAEAGIDVRWRSLTRTRKLWNCAAGAFGCNPLQAVYSWHPEFMRLLVEMTARERFHVVHVEHLRGALYGLGLLQALKDRPGRPAVVWDSVDCISHLFRQASVRSASLFGRQVTRVELSRTQVLERYLTSQFDRVLVTSPVDRRALADLAGPTVPEPVVLPQGVDLDYFTPGAGYDPATVVMTGKMSYHANVTAALFLLKDVMPLVWRRRPEARVAIVGKNPPRALLRFRGPQVSVPGAVPDIRPYLRRAAVAVAPVVYGAGIQNKVLEAMACGAPVVTTPQGVSALNALPGRDLLVGEHADAIAIHILDMIGSAPRRFEVARAGRRYVERHHRLADTAASLEAIYADLVESAAPAYASC